MGAFSRLNLGKPVLRIEPNPSHVGGHGLGNSPIITGNSGAHALQSRSGAARLIGTPRIEGLRHSVLGGHRYTVSHARFGSHGAGVGPARNVGAVHQAQAPARMHLGEAGLWYQTSYEEATRAYTACWAICLPEGVAPDSFAGTHHILMNYIDVVLEGRASELTFDRLLDERASESNWVSINGSEELTPVFDVYYAFANHMAGFEERRTGRYASDVSPENIFEFAWARNYTKTKLKPAHKVWSGVSAFAPLNFDNAVTRLAVQLYDVHAAYPRMNAVAGHRKELSDLLRVAGGEARFSRVSHYLRVATDAVDAAFPNMALHGRNAIVREAIRTTNAQQRGFRGMKQQLMTATQAGIAAKQELFASVGGYR